MTTTGNKGYTLPTVGADSGVWGTELNADWLILDSNLGGTNSKSVAGNTNVVATATEARSLTQRLTGLLTGNITYSLPGPGSGGFWVIDNQTTGAFTINCNVSGGTGIIVPQGSAMLVYSDATNMYPATGKRTGSLVATITGTTTNDSAGTGIVGEYVSSTVLVGSAVSLTTLTAATVTSISLTAGDWDVSGNVATKPAASSLTTQVLASINTTAATLPAIPNSGAYALVYPASSAGAITVVPVGKMRISLASTTTVYLVAEVQFSVSTMGAYGFIGARRAR